MATWSRISDPENDGGQLPAWFVSRMTAVRGAFGLLLATGDVLRVISLSAAHVSSDGLVLLDVLLDHAGVPDGVDTAWESKHYLGAPLPGATRATVNMAHVVAAIEFSAAQNAEGPGEISGSATQAISDTVGELKQAAEVAVKPSASGGSDEQTAVI
jgi:hypothetical protein